MGKSSMITISFVIPAYNVSSYLPKCINSILDLKSIEYEIIIVNDGSTDETESIALDFVKKYANIRLLNKSNGGVSTARNYGLKAAKGEWIWFVDADDWIETKNVQNYISQVIQSNAFDIIFFGVNNTKDLNISSVYMPTTKKKEFISLSDFYSNVRYRGEIWCYLFKRKILKDYSIYFTEGIKYGEDGEFTFKAMLHANNICVLPVVFYNQLNRPNSAMNTAFTSESLRNHFVILCNLLEYINNFYCKNKFIFIKGVLSTQLKHYIRCIHSSNISLKEKRALIQELNILIKGYSKYFTFKSLLKTKLYLLFTK